MTWNYRVLAHEHDIEIILEICEVYYNREGNPESYAENCTVMGVEMREIESVLDMMSSAIEKPILWAGDRFPQEYKPYYHE